MSSIGSAGTETAESYIARMADQAAARPDDAEPDSPETPSPTVPPDPAPAAVADPIEDAAPPADAAPRDTPQAEASPPSPDQAAVATTTGAPEPFRFVADGREVDIPGIVRAANGDITIPATAWPRVLPYLRDHRAVTQQLQSAKAEVKHWQDQATARKTRGEQLWDKLSALVEGPEDKLIEFFEKRQQMAPILKAEAEKAELQQRLEARESQESAVAEQQQVADLNRQLRETTTQWADYYAKRPEYQGVDAKRIDRLLWDLRYDLWFQADERGVPEWNIPPHGYGINHDLLQERLTEVVGDIRQREAAIKAAQEAAQRNATALAPSAAPPAVSAKATGDAARVPAKPTTTEEYLAHMERLARG